MRERTVTAACRTPDGIEWTTVKISQDGAEPVRHEQLPLVIPDDASPDDLAKLDLPDLSEVIKGQVTVALRSSELLMRTIQLPTVNPVEIADMISFQVDKISPFPIDQLAMSHETLQTSDDSARVLMAAAKRKQIDAIGDTFEAKGTRIQSIDARVLGWLQLFSDEGRLTGDGCEVLLIIDGIDFVLVVLSEGLPICFRPLDMQLDDMTIVDELTYEIQYTLTTLAAEYSLPEPDTLHCWTLENLPAVLKVKLESTSGLKVKTHDLAEIPPLSEGILRRTLRDGNRIELIPREWVEHQQHLKLRKQFTTIAGSIAAVWIFVLLIFLSVFKVRDMKLAAVKADAEAIAPLAQQAQANQRKLKALKVYTDRTDSSLECLREITRTLPVGDIEFVSYNYTKDKGISLRGSGRDKSLVTDFFASLNKSPLFNGIANESSRDKTIKGVRRTEFSVTLPLVPKEDDE
ncbi:hypothetical protein P4C99_05570 [Pontiellaceae bacterium B1224]|nr:hypothetical protein [Pontiellaceae bacterium B1224]